MNASARVCIDIQYHYYANNDVEYLEEKKNVWITFAVGQSEGQCKDFTMSIVLCLHK